MAHDRSTRIAQLALATAALALTATACSSGSGGSAAQSTEPVGGPVQNVTVHTTDDLRFVPDMIRVHAGTVRITLVNDGSYPHNLAVSKLRVRSGDVSGSPGSQQTTVTFSVASAGTYQFVCTYHAGAGMRGTLIVTR